MLPQCFAPLTFSGHDMLSFRASRKAPLVHHSIAIITCRLKERHADRVDLKSYHDQLMIETKNISASPDLLSLESEIPRLQSGLHDQVMRWGTWGITKHRRQLSRASVVQPRRSSEAQLASAGEATGEATGEGGKASKSAIFHTKRGYLPCLHPSPLQEPFRCIPRDEDGHDFAT